MQVKGKIIAEMPMKSGISKASGKEWKSKEYVILLEGNDDHPKRICFEVFGEDRLKEFWINVGDELTVHLDIDAREYNGRWYNTIRAWKVDK